jgi:phospholipid-translocating ATPase
MFVSMDLIRLLQIYFIHNDMDMYDPVSNETAVANITDVNEDLGQVEYMFVGKQALLGNSDLVFRQAFVGGKLYGGGNPDATEGSYTPFIDEPSTFLSDTIEKILQ